MKKIYHVLLMVIAVSVIFSCSDPMVTVCNPASQSLLANPVYIDTGDAVTVGGDIVLFKNDPTHQKIIQSLDSSAAGRGMSQVLTDFWDNGYIPYVYTTDFTQKEKSIIERAMRTIESVCNVHFVEGGSGSCKYKIGLLTDPELGGQSSLGESVYAFVNFNRSIFDRTDAYGIVLHEFGHGLGLGHEHQRLDRDDYVSIEWDNIAFNWNLIHDAFIYGQFAITLVGATNYTGYDYDSIMHYSAYACSKDPNNLVTIDSHGHAIGQSDHLSVGDKATLAAIYGTSVPHVSDIRAITLSLGDNCSIGVLTNYGRFLAKAVFPGFPFVSLKEDVVKIAISGSRYAALTSSGYLYVKEGIYGDWVLLKTGIIDIALGENRVGALDANGSFFVKEGSLYSDWVSVKTNISKIDLAGNRIGALSKDGNFYIKEGTLYASWINVRTDIKEIALNGSRIGALTNNDYFYVKEGSVYSDWILEKTEVERIYLAGSRIGAVTTNGYFYVKEGTLNADWLLETSSQIMTSLGDTAIAYVTTDGRLMIKNGSLYASWVQY